MAFFWRRKKEDQFSSSVLGLDKSIEELKAQEEAVEREIGVRFTKAIEKTRGPGTNGHDPYLIFRRHVRRSRTRRHFKDPIAAFYLALRKTPMA
ncbi:MAG: hypothetical protein DMF62_10850 [Acidobacteria bacterium]|nr:MAG: hypothetical protein DMF62_10850 [Acidobacteriota bacterium]